MNISIIENIVGSENILLDEPMKKHTTFRCGGNAKVYVTPDSIDSLVEVVKALNLLFIKSSEVSVGIDIL